MFKYQFAYRVAIIPLALFSLSTVLAAEDVTPHSTRPRIALVLSGGGALGMAHIGVLKTLEQMRIPVDCVVGTSMGALVGGAYADGVSPQRMESILVNTDISTLFDDQPPRAEITQNIKRDDFRSFFETTLGFNHGEVMLPSGASSGYKFELFLKQLLYPDASLAQLDFDSLPLPYRSVATDLETGEMKVFNQGSLTRAMRASMSLPAIVAPVTIGDRTYIDGGLVRNLPVDIGRKLCGDVVIAVNLGSKPKSLDEIHSSIDVALQSLLLLTEQNVSVSLSELGPEDVLISPKLGDFDLLSFHSQREIIERGVEAALAKKQKLQQFAVTEADYKRWQARFSKPATQATITKITVSSQGYVTPESVRRDLDIGLHEKLDQKKLHQDLEKLYGRGDFAYVGYAIKQHNAGDELVVQTRSKSWGPGYLKFGLGALTDFTSPTQYNLLATYRRTWINSLGAEWRTDIQFGHDSLLRTAFIQPLQASDGAFITPYLEYRRFFKPFYIDNERVGDYLIARRNAGLDIGVTGSLGEIRLGTYYSRVDSKPEFGVANPLFTDVHPEQYGVIADLIYDQLDTVSFPRSGFYTRLYLEDAKYKEDSIIHFRKAQVSLTGAFSLGHHTFSLHYEWGDELTGLNDLPVYDDYTLGGPGRLSGLYLGQLNGSRYDLETLTYYYRLTKLPVQIGHGIYVGGSIESGKINDQLMQDPSSRINAGSIFVGTDTILGVLKLSRGVTDSGQKAWYLQLGNSF